MLASNWNGGGVSGPCLWVAYLATKALGLRQSLWLGVCQELQGVLELNGVAGHLVGIRELKD